MICGYSQQNWLEIVVYPGCIIISCVSFEDFFGIDKLGMMTPAGDEGGRQRHGTRAEGFKR